MADRPPALPLTVAVLTVAALVAVAAYLLGAQSTTSTVAPTGAAAPTSAPVLRAAPSSEPVASGAASGPQLTDSRGDRVDDATAEQVRDVYNGLQTGDITALNTAYAADGSDQGLDIEPHLHDARVRSRLLDALRARPTRSGASYTYRLSGYTLSFNQAGALGAGLGSITGPWGDQAGSPVTTVSASSGHATKKAAHAKGATRAPARGGYGPGRPVIEADRSSDPGCQGITLDDLPGACVCGGGTDGINDVCP